LTARDRRLRQHKPSRLAVGQRRRVRIQCAPSCVAAVIACGDHPDPESAARRPRGLHQPNTATTVSTARSRRRLRVTMVALACLLLAQWSLFAHACPVIKRAGESIAHTQLLAELAAQAAQDCHDAGLALESPAEPPVCLKHCADEGSAGGASPMQTAAPPPLIVRAAPPAASGPLHWQRAPACFDATAPPLSILYCVSLT